MTWWLSRGGKAEGPFPAEHIVHWIKSGQFASDTFACPEGGQTWKKLYEIAEFECVTPPPPPSPPGPAAMPPTAELEKKGTVGTRFGVLIAAITLAGIGLILELLLIGDTGEEISLGLLITIGVAIAHLITWAMFHYGLWKAVPEQYREVTPGKAVGFLFIPLFNCYWVFCSYLNVNRGLNRLADAHSLPPPRANVGLATAASVFFVVSWFLGLIAMTLPTLDNIQQQYVIRDQVDLNNAYNDVVAMHVGFDLTSFLLSSVPGFVVWLLMVMNQKRILEHLIQHQAPIDTSSSLIAPSP